MTEQNESWVITNVQDDFVTQPGQGTVPAKSVTFKTYLGQISTVKVPDTEFNADTVADIVDNAANTLMQVSTLKGSLVVPNTPVFNPETGLYE